MFETNTPAEALRILTAAQATLRRDGFGEPAALRELDRLAALVASNPLAGVALDDVYAPCATFLVEAPAHGVPTPSTNPKGDVRVVSCHDGMLLSLAYRRGSSAGDPNAFVERALGVPATTRTWTPPFCQALVS